MKNQSVYKMAFSRIYPMYLQKVENKGRTKEEVDGVICWLTGYDNSGLQAQLKKKLIWSPSLPKPHKLTPMHIRSQA